MSFPMFKLMMQYEDEALGTLTFTLSTVIGYYVVQVGWKDCLNDVGCEWTLVLLYVRLTTLKFHATKSLSIGSKTVQQ